MSIPKRKHFERFATDIPPFSLRNIPTNKQSHQMQSMQAEQNMMKPEKVSEELANANVSFKCIKKPKHLSCFCETQQFKSVSEHL